MTNTSGNLTYRAEFDPYGKLLYEWSATPNQNTKKFTGYERDAGSGLDYAQARMYGSEWGRFMSPDPIGLEGASKNSPLSYNRYSYVNGNPVNHIDPSGNLLANPDESGGSACTGFFWGSFTNDDYGNSTIRVWGGFWSCQVSGGGGEGIQPEKKQKKKPSSINLSYAYQSIDEKSIANFAINKAGRKSANLEILAAFCKKDTVFDIAINFSTTNVNLVFDPYIPIQGRSIRPNKSTLILVNDNISIEDITVKILNDKGLDRDGNELASYQWLLRIKILNETADKILSSVNINARGQETLYLGRAVPLVFDEATLNISCNAE